MNQTEIRKLLEEDAQQIYLGNLKTVEFDLDLPLTGKNGSVIHWHSTDERWLNDQGGVGRPPFGRGNRVVQLTATLELSGEKLQRIFEVRILEAENDVKVAEVYPIRLSVAVGAEFYLPTAVAIKTENGHVISHSVEWQADQPLIATQAGETTYNGHIKGLDHQITANVTAVIDLDPIKARAILKTPVGIDKIRLTEGTPMKTIQDQRLSYLLAQDEDQMLYNFRVAAGLDTKGAPEMIGWDSPESKLRGHTTGHYLSALALAYGATGDQRALDKLTYLVEELGKVQLAFQQLPGVKPGFLSAYDETQFNLLEKFKPYPEIWAPYYTLHKIFAGLLDSYQLAGLTGALEIADRLGDWVYDRLSQLTHHQLQEMWGMYIAGEFGGMNESLAELYRHTGKPQHLAAAKLFDNDRLYFPMLQKVDALGGLHANQHIPQIVGTMKMYEAGQEEQYFQISDYFWEAVVGQHIYAMGGTGDGELFQQADQIASHLTKNTTENCASYNMLKLTQQLYRYQPDNKYLDYYENVMLNHILATPDHDHGGESTYFMATQPGAQRFFEVENSCCHGTGMENHFKYGTLLACYDQQYLDLNFYLPATIQDASQQLQLQISCSDDLVSEITIQVDELGGRRLRLRHPNWADSLNFEVDGQKRELSPVAGFYEMPAGAKTISITPTLSIRMTSTPDDPKIFSIHAGPFLLVALAETTEFLHLPVTPATVAEVLQPIGDNHYRLGTLEFMPTYQLDQEYYHMYFKQAE